MASPGTRLRTGILALGATIGLLLPAAASAAQTIAPAPATQYNTTPACPVSAANPVCAWNVPVDSANLFTAQDYGQCPYWAVEKYPGLVLNEASHDPLANNWNGGNWLEHAQQEGLATGSSPAPGDLAVWQPTSSDPVGHVAYVEAVFSDGSIVVSQMDGNSAAPFPALQGTTEYISASDVSYFAANAGLAFVITGSASSTPLSSVVDLSATPSGVTVNVSLGGLTVAATVGSPASAVNSTGQASRPVTALATAAKADRTTLPSSQSATRAHTQAARVRTQQMRHHPRRRHHLSRRRVRAHHHRVSRR